MHDYLPVNILQIIVPKGEKERKCGEGRKRQKRQRDRNGDSLGNGTEGKLGTMVAGSVQW